MADDEKPRRRRTQKPDDAVNLDTHPLVAKLGAESEEPPTPVVTFVGYIGPSKNPDSVRLYTDLSFRTYYEIPRASIRSNDPGADEDSPTRVTVDADARIEVVQTERQSVEAAYLAGSIAGRYLTAASRRPPIFCDTAITGSPTDCGRQDFAAQPQYCIT